MIVITFPDREIEKRAIGVLLGRFSGRILKSGEHIVPEAALEVLADEGIEFTVEGTPTYAQRTAPFRDPPALQFNDGREVPPDLFADAIVDLVDNFGALTYETQRVEGHWSHQDRVYRDSLAKLVVDVPDNQENRDWMLDFKLRWRVRLEQIDLWVVSYKIEVE